MRDSFLIILNGLLSSDSAVDYYRRIILPDEMKAFPEYDAILNHVLKYYDEQDKIITANILIKKLPAILHKYVTDSGKIEFDFVLFKVTVDEFAEYFKKKALLKLAEWIPKHIDSKSIKEIADILTVVSDNILRTESEEKQIQDITAKVKDFYINGMSQNYLLTGNPFFDMYVGFRKNLFLLIAADKKMGKTRYLSRLMYDLILNKQKVDISWHTLEMPATDIIQSLVATITGIPEMIIKELKRKRTEYETKEVINALDEINSMPIEFNDKPVDIHQVCRRFRSFCKRKAPNDTIKVLIVDNIGCLAQTSDNETSSENEIARRLMQLRDETDGLIIALHHMGKDVNSKFNKDRGYEPTLNSVRGTNRLPDFANITLLLYRPSTYKDLLAEVKGMNDPVFYTKFRKYLKIIIAANRTGSMDDKSEIHYTHDMDIMQFKELPI
jgi:replicative DNA helicase